MKISSKSILSPGRAAVARDPPNSLSTSLSRRLRNSGSIKGGASPAMFPTTAKKRGSFENPEPSSPKVTCIGQVRVKSKKQQAKKLRTLSRRHSAGDASFRKLEHPVYSKTQNQRESFDLGSSATQNHHQNPNQECSPAQRSWFHFPVTICDALRAFGSEFSCLLPCRKEEKTVAMEEGNRQGACGAVFARWLVAVQDGDGGAERDIELVVGEGEEEENVFKKPRRHVFEDLEIINDKIEGHDESRVSTCIPPKNALLLMRSRSDPMKAEALTFRSWEPNLYRNEEHGDECFEKIEEETVGLKEPLENLENEARNQENSYVEQDEANPDQEHENVQQYEANQDQEPENVQQDQAGREQYKELRDKEESLDLGLLFDELKNQDLEFDEEKTVETGAMELTMVTEFAGISEFQEVVDNGVLERENDVKDEKESKRVLPECLLMMMHEPKLSSEVSNETWVCSTDFIKPRSNRRNPPLPVPRQGLADMKTDGGDQSVVSGSGNATVDDVTRAGNPLLHQPARSSCSFPAEPAMATVRERKVADAVGYEPFVLTRCKSEPMKTAVAKLLPESCVWENRKMERLSRVEFSVGAAALGF